MRGAERILRKLLNHRSGRGIQTYSQRHVREAEWQKMSGKRMGGIFQAILKSRRGRVASKVQLG